MLKKKVSSIVTAAHRMCKCGEKVTIDPLAKITRCNKCGEIVYENEEISQGDSGTESADSE